MERKTDIEVAMVGEDGNVFAVIGRVSRALKRGGRKELAEEFTKKAMEQSSYDDVLQLMFAYVVPV